MEKWSCGAPWSSQEWKSGAAEHDRSGKLEVNSWDSLQKVDPHREEYLLGRNVHSARYGELGRTELQGSWPRKGTEISTVSMESRLNSSGTSSQDSQLLQLCGKINDLLSDLGKTPETFTGRILFMSMFNDIFCDRYDNKDECLRTANIVKKFAGRFGIGQWSFIGPGSEKKWYPSENSPQGAWDHIAEDMPLEFAESGHPIFRATAPLSRGQLKSKGRGKLSIHFTARYS